MVVEMPVRNLKVLHVPLLCLFVSIVIDQFVMGHPGQMAIRRACHIHALLTQRGHITWACLTISLEGRSKNAGPPTPLPTPADPYFHMY